MKALMLMSLILLGNTMYAQSISLQLDSISKIIMSQHQKKRFQIFSDLVKERENKHLSNRIDTSKNDYIFIIEEFTGINGEFHIDEFYFDLDDTLAKTLYFDTLQYSPAKYYDQSFYTYFFLTKYQYTLNPMLKTFRALQAFQTLTYDPFIIVSSGCVRNISSENKRANLEIKQKTNRLRTSYQILTLIDRRQNTIVTSFQIPPKHFHFETKLYFPVWDF